MFYFYRFWKIFLNLLIFILIFSTTYGQVPQLINYQGKLTDNTGNPVADGPYSVEFKLYEDELTGDYFWSSGFQTIIVTGGLFNHTLGENTPLSDEYFRSGSEPFLGITVNADPEISPRTQITSTAFAWQSIRSDQTELAFGVEDDCITEIKIANYAVTNIKIAANAVTEDKIINEPGVAHTYKSTYEVDAQLGTVDSVVIDVPSAGFVVVTVTGYFDFGFDIDGDWIKASLSKVRGSIDGQNLAYFTCSNGSAIWQYKDNFSITVVDVISSSGEYKYFLTVDENDDSIFTESYLKHLHLTAVFYPTAYGTVNDEI